MLKMKSASLGLVASAVAGVLLTGSPANAQADLAGYWHHHSSHRIYHSHRHIALNHNRPRIFIRIFIYNRNNNIAIARNEQAQAQRERQRQRQLERQRQRQFEDPSTATRSPGAPGTASAPLTTSSAPSTSSATPTVQAARPQMASAPSAVREQAPGAAPRQSASSNQDSGADSWQTP